MLIACSFVATAVLRRSGPLSGKKGGTNRQRETSILRQFFVVHAVPPSASAKKLRVRQLATARSAAAMKHNLSIDADGVLLQEIRESVNEGARAWCRPCSRGCGSFSGAVVTKPVAPHATLASVVILHASTKQHVVRL
jgi:hypothetical protein